MEAQAGKKKRNGLLIVIIVLLLAIIGLLVWMLFFRKTEENVQDLSYEDQSGLVYTDADSLQAAMDQMMEDAQNDVGFIVYYDRDGYSQNGTDVTCYIGNDAANDCDVIFHLYADPEMTDELYATQLVPPGAGIGSFTLNHALDPGDHEVYCLHSVVREVDGKKQIVHEFSVVITIHVG